jgi:hypothetical protein
MEQLLMEMISDDASSADLSLVLHLTSERVRLGGDFDSGLALRELEEGIRSLRAKLRLLDPEVSFYYDEVRPYSYHEGSSKPLEFNIKKLSKEYIENNE